MEKSQELENARKIILELKDKVKELELCIQENAARSQRIIFQLELKIKELQEKK